MSHIYCPECGFQNPEAANYCARCGALLVKDDAGAETTHDASRPRRSTTRRSRRSRSSASKGPALVVRSGGGRAGETLPPAGRAHDDRPLARLRRSSSTTSPSPASTPCSSQRDGALLRSRTRAASTARSSTASGSSQRRARERRRAPDRQVPADLPRAMSATAGTPSASDGCSRSATVCQPLKDEFPDISISKIRYLEDQGLLAPRAHAAAATGSSARTTSSGCETILRLQRDEFLPLRVIREELAAPGAHGAASAGAPAASASARGRARPRRALRARRRSRASSRASSRSSACSSRGARAASKRYAETRRRHRGRLRAARALRRSRRGTCARSAPPPTARPALLEQLVAPALRARNPERRQAGLEDLQALGRARAGALAAPLLARRCGSVARQLMRSATCRTKIRDVPDFPKPGSSSRTSCRCSPTRRRSTQTIDQLAEWAEPRQPDLVLGAEARGFILGAALAYELGCGFVAGAAARASCRRRRSARPTRSSTARTRSSCTPTRSRSGAARARSTTTCSPPAAPSRRSAASSSSSAARSSASASSSS